MNELIEIIKTISMLCSISSNTAQLAQIKYEQITCQQYYIKCVFGETTTLGKGYFDEQLQRCILERNITN